MDTPTTYPRINIYLDDPELKTQVKIAAARHGVTASSYCLEAIKQRLRTDEAGEVGTSMQSTPSTAREAARTLDSLRNRIGPMGTPVSELIAEGRRR